MDQLATLAPDIHATIVDARRLATKDSIKGISNLDSYDEEDDNDDDGGDGGWGGRGGRGGRGRGKGKDKGGKGGYDIKQNSSKQARQVKAL